MTWLEPENVTELLGTAVPAQAAPGVLAGLCAAVRAWVEPKRADLLVSDGLDPETLTYTPTADVKLGAALMVLRLYHRRTTPLGIAAASEAGDQFAGILREDPDITRLLGIGRHGRFVFGAPPRPTEVL